ncbi:efflux RND transporter periplasmic adaptor subunit [Rhizobium sp. CG4]|uniref:efflux RND transporter periplasmic adaptor subunit n=1 Tax=unclassified Rhizobium TaxID=2613769 RepID=UPI0020332BEF|nr:MULTISPECIES: efflux RND transporter periplasmic adaptor subunit [unclassified Rhizobium]MCM2458183.1 efflux RND transporter periplasmic adaptor subunit [Rhizobium sp. CG4]MCS4243099.1 RND family efflux transporter MFP subunit [Rhizobium sp. BIGb0125]
MRGLAILTAILLFLSGCSEDKPKSPTSRPIISTVIKGDDISFSGYPGVVHARTTSEHGFRILGSINGRLVDVGDQISVGQVLATLESSSQTLAVSAAQAELRNSQARRFNAQTSKERQNTLAEAGLGTTAALEQADQALVSAEANVTKASAILDKAKEQLGYTILRAQFDGIVTATAAEVGQTVEAGQTIVTVAQPREREVVIDVSDEVYSRLQLGTPFDLRLQLNEEVTAKGIVRELAPSADTLTRTRRVRISLLTPPDAFRIGAVVSALIAQDDLVRVSIPRRSIFHDGGTFVWVVDEKNETVNRRPVQIDPSRTSPEIVWISQGVSVGERIALAGLSKLSEGQKVKLSSGSAP